MARTKQTKRNTSPDAKVVYRYKRVAVLRPRPKDDDEEEEENNIVPQCVRCNESMASYKEFGVQQVCPPCVKFVRAKQISVRSLLNIATSGFALFIPSDMHESIRVIPFSELESSKRELMHPDVDGISKMSYSRRCEHTLNTQYRLLYLTDQRSFSPNIRAEWLAMTMDLFDLDPTDPVSGPVIFLGPKGLPLTKTEVATFELQLNKFTK